MAGVKRNNDCRKSSSKRDKIKEADEHGRRVQIGTGIDGEAGVRVQPTFKPKSGRKIIEGPDNAAAVVLDNSPRYASGGGDFASRVSIVAGINGHKLNEDDQIEDLTPLHDAAGIYVIQKDDPQDIFGSEVPLANPAFSTVGNMKQIPDSLLSDKAKSHVTAYADTIQLVARNGGVNIYAGGVDKTLSSGIPNREFMGVNLIYGNKADYEYSDSPYSLQPLVKGHNLEAALNNIIERVDDLNNTVFGLMLAIGQLELNLAAHTHITAGLGVGLAAPSIELLIGAALRAPQHVKTALKTITTSINNVISEINNSSLTTAGINSRFNKTN